MGRDSESRPARAGRGRSRSRGRFPNRGKSKGDSNRKSSYKTFKYNKSDPKLYKFAPKDRSIPNQATYATIKEAIITEINKTFEKGALDVVHALEKEQIEDLESLRPTLKQTTKDSEKDPQGYEHEREQNKIDYI